MRYILTLDVGTTSVKTCIFDEEFRIVGSSSEEYKLLTPAPNIVELEPENYWEACRRGIKAALGYSGIQAGDCCALSVTTQGETLLAVDEGGNPLGNAIVWLDSRAVEEAAIIQSKFAGETVYRVTGMPEISSACPASKLLWLRRNVPERFERVHKFLLLMDYLVFKLTGKYAADRCLMSSTGYFDINTGELWGEMLDLIGVGRNRIPELYDSGTHIGVICSEAAIELGLSGNTVVTTGGMDQAASAVGAGNVKEGIVTETTGTALVVAATTHCPSFENTAKINMMRHAIRGRYLILPYNQTAGMALKWFKDEFCKYEEHRCLIEGELVYAGLDRIASGVPPLSDGLLFLPHMAGMLTPEINPAAKGIFFGVGLNTGKAHFIRAILEGVSYMLKENLDLLSSMGLEIRTIRSLGGGAKSPLWCGIKADICNCEIQTMEQDESTSLGAAIMASLAVGMFKCADEACKAVKVRKSYKSDVVTAAAYGQGYRKFKTLYQCVKSMF